MRIGSFLTEAGARKALSCCLAIPKQQAIATTQARKQESLILANTVNQHRGPTLVGMAEAKGHSFWYNARW